MEIIKQIKEEMDKQGISISKMAWRLDITDQAVFRWFNGNSYPTLKHLDKMTKILGCELKLTKGEEDVREV